MMNLKTLIRRPSGTSDPRRHLGTCRTITTLAVGALLVSLVPAQQSNWSQLKPRGSTPAVRYAHAMAYDSIRNCVVMFGGAGSTGLLNDTWEWNGSRWTERSPSLSPPARFAPGAMVYASAPYNCCVLFGGATGTYGPPSLGDTWTWDGTNWNNATPTLPAESPSARYSQGMAYDSGHSCVVLFSGGDGTQDPFDDTWVWDGSWTEITPGTSARPPGLYFSAMTYDSSRQVCVLFGGAYRTLNGPMADSDETWEWDGTAWSHRNAGGGPLKRHAPSMTYDASLGSVVLFGGRESVNDTLFGDAWAWDGSAWRALSSRKNPSARLYTGLVYTGNVSGGTSLLFGGVVAPWNRLNDTWTLDAN